MKFKITEEYIGKDRLTRKPFTMSKEIKRKPKFTPTGDKDFDNYVKRYYLEWPETKKDLWVSVDSEFPELNVVDIDMSGSYKRGTPNQDSDLDVKIYYTDNIDESDLAEEMKTLWSDYGVHDVHFQRVYLK